MPRRQRERAAAELRFSLLGRLALANELVGFVASQQSFTFHGNFQTSGSNGAGVMAGKVPIFTLTSESRAMTLGDSSRLA